VVTDSNNCTVSDSAVVNQPQSMSTAITAINTTCFAGSDGVLITVTGAALPTGVQLEQRTICYGGFAKYFSRELCGNCN